MGTCVGPVLPAPKTLPEPKFGPCCLERAIGPAVQVQRAGEVRVEAIVGTDQSAATQGERADNRPARPPGLIGQHVHQRLGLRAPSALNVSFHELGCPLEMGGIPKAGDGRKMSGLFKRDDRVVWSPFAEL